MFFFFRLFGKIKLWKFIKNKLFYKFYRYLKYKLNYFPSYGATGEDVLINKIFKGKIGFYVDVGALHPVNGSNTYNLYKNGWKGINFDLMNENIKLFKIFRPKDISLNLAVSSKTGFINSYIFDSGSGLNTLEKKWAEKWKKKINKDYQILHQLYDIEVIGRIAHLRFKKTDTDINKLIEKYQYDPR